MPRAVTFWILWAIDFLVALVFVYFFSIGLADGTVSSVNVGLWMVILVLLAGVVMGSYLLKRMAQHVLAFIVLGLLAVPAVGGALILLLTSLTNPRWN